MAEMKGSQGQEGLREGFGAWPKLSQPLDQRGTTQISSAAMQADRTKAERENRSPITMWDFAVWAYAKEKVRFLCGIEPGIDDAEPRDFSQTGLVERALASGYAQRHMVNTIPLLAPACHEDALALHGLVSTLGRDDLWLFVRAAENVTLPPWSVPEPDWRISPVLRKKGKVQHLYAAGNQPVACAVRCVGWIAGFEPVSSYAEYVDLCESVRRRYARFVEICTALAVVDDYLCRWKITGTGVDAAPWRAAA